MTDIILNPIVTDRDDWTSLATYGDGVFIPIDDIPMSFVDGRAENNLDFAAFNVRWGVAGQFNLTEAVSVSEVSFAYGVNGMNVDGHVNTRKLQPQHRQFRIYLRPR